MEWSPSRDHMANVPSFSPPYRYCRVTVIMRKAMSKSLQQCYWIKLVFPTTFRIMIAHSSYWLYLLAGIQQWFCSTASSSNHAVPAECGLLLKYSSATNLSTTLFFWPISFTSWFGKQEALSGNRSALAAFRANLTAAYLTQHLACLSWRLDLPSLKGHASLPTLELMACAPPLITWFVKSRWQYLNDGLLRWRVERTCSSHTT